MEQPSRASKVRGNRASKSSRIFKTVCLPIALEAFITPLFCISLRTRAGHNRLSLVATEQRNGEGCFSAWESCWYVHTLDDNRLLFLLPNSTTAVMVRRGRKFGPGD
jgi:hypothetical protein